jgi:hypothetical protein
MRKVTIEYGQEVEGSAYGPLQPWSLTSEGDEDYRVQFRFTRTNTNSADTGRIRIYNLPPEFVASIRNGTREANADRASIMDDVRWRDDMDRRNAELRELAQANIVKVYAGYQDGTKQIFQGDITDLDVNSMGSDVDTITSINLGDAIIPLKFGWLNKSFDGNTKLADLLTSIITSSGILPSKQSLDFMDNVLPGVEVLEFRNGAIVQGDIKPNVDAIVARYGVQWFIRNGEFYLMPRGSLIDDFAIRLDMGDNLLRPLSELDGDDISFTMLLDGDVLPGRGFRIYDELGKPTSNYGYRADTVDYIGDTHANPWYCMVKGSRIEDPALLTDFAVLTPSPAIFSSENVAVP